MSLWTDLLDLQHGRCGICGERPDDRLVEDHDHNTGLIRGLLCRSCNTLEGQHSTLDRHTNAMCPVCLWRMTPAVAWLGYTERYEGWYSGEDEFRERPYYSAVDRAALFHRSVIATIAANRARAEAAA